MLRHENDRFETPLRGLDGERPTLRSLLEAMGDETFDYRHYRDSAQGEHFARHNVLLDYGDGMDAEVLEFWRGYGKGLVKRLHDTDDDYPWYSYVPVSAFAPENRGRVYPMIFQVNRKTDLVAESYGHAFVAAEDEAILIFPKYTVGMAGFTDPKNPVYGQNDRELPTAEDFWPVLQAAFDVLPVDRSRVYLTGFSFPGFRSVAFALEHPDVFAGLMLNAHLYPYVWDIPGDERLADIERVKLPMINIAGMCDYGHPYPLYHAQHELTNNGHDHDRTAEQAIERPNLWYRINDCPPVTLEEALETQHYPDSRSAERTVGIPATAAATVVLDDTPHHFTDIASRDGVVRTRFVAIENCPHWPHGTFARLSWDYIKHFSRNPATGDSVFDGVTEPFDDRAAVS